MLTHQIVCQLLPADRVSPGRKKSHPEPGSIPLAAGRRKSSVYRKATERMPLRETKRKRTQIIRKNRNRAGKRKRSQSPGNNPESSRIYPFMTGRAVPY